MDQFRWISQKIPAVPSPEPADVDAESSHEDHADRKNGDRFRARAKSFFQEIFDVHEAHETVAETHTRKRQHENEIQPYGGIRDLPHVNEIGQNVEAIGKEQKPYGHDEEYCDPVFHFPEHGKACKKPRQESQKEIPVEEQVSVRVRVEKPEPREHHAVQGEDEQEQGQTEPATFSQTTQHLLLPTASFFNTIDARRPTGCPGRIALSRSALANGRNGQQISLAPGPET